MKLYSQDGCVLLVCLKCHCGIGKRTTVISNELFSVAEIL